jgi:hypothetical protein
MLKRTPSKRKTKRPVEKPVELPDFLKGYTGPLGDENIDFSDYAFWIDGTKLRIDEDWLNAFKAVDQHGDKKPLTALLRSTREQSPIVHEYLADLIERKMVPVPMGRSRIAAYDRSDIERRLLLAVYVVRNYYIKALGYGIQAAIEKAAQDFAISPDTLGDAYAGRRTVARRIRKRRGALK